MKLIHLAHRGEAQEFTKNLDLVAHSEINGLYLGEKIAVLISDEGIYNTLSKISLCLGKFKFDKILNFGIAGALDSKLEIDEIYQIRTSYSFGDKPEFKSFTSKTNSIIDCISTHERVLNLEFANKLSSFAKIVDRELWAVGFAAKQANIPFESYKLISDYAGKTDCFDIKNKALSFSEKLFSFYQKLEDIETPNYQYTPPISMSFTNKARYEKLITLAVNKYEYTEELILEKINTHEIINEKIREKAKVSILLNRIEEFINPINTKAKFALDQNFSIFTKIGAKVNYDKNLENKSFSLVMEINSQTNLDNLKRSIDLFNMSKHNQIWNGSFDV